MKSIFFMAASAAAALSISAPATAADYYFKRTASPVALSDAPGTPVVVASVQVPAGTWIVSAKASLVNFGGADFARCTRYSSNSPRGGASTMTGQAESMPAVATVSILDVVTLATSRWLKLECYHDGAVSGQYVDPDAAIVAMRAPGTQ